MTRLMRQLPRAIRRDHDPFKFLAGIGVGTLLAFLRWSNLQCPHCRRVFRRTYLPNEVRIGEGERMCPHCGRAFDDGSREWRELSRREQIRFLLPTPIMGILGALIVCSTLAIFASLELGAKLNWRFLQLLVLCCMAIVICYAASRLPHIWRSLGRGAANSAGEPDINSH